MSFPAKFLLHEGAVNCNRGPLRCVGRPGYAGENLRTGEKFIGATAGVPYGTPAKRPMHSGAVRWSNRSMNEALDRDGGGFTAADAKRGNTAL